MKPDVPKKGGHACVLVSGGVESGVLLNDALGRYDDVTPVYVRNHLRWEDVEVFCLKNFVRHLKHGNLKPLKLLELPNRDLYEGHWSITGMKVPGANSRDESMYLPGRNILLLSKAAVFAATKNITHIEIGVLRGNPFSDATKPFFRKIASVFSTGLGKEIHIEAPFQKMQKEDVIVLGKKLPLEMTFSCVNPKGFEHCGECNKCLERKKAFFAAGVFDKTKYKKPGL